MKQARKLVELSQRWLCPAIFAGYLVFYLVDTDRYYQTLREDHVIEWLTFVALLAVGLVAMALGWRYRGAGDRRAWFLLLLGIVCLGGALEEISWGQRVLGVESPEFFLEHSDQQEVNVHNVLQQKLGFYTKDLVAAVLLCYGLVLPLLAKRPEFADLCRQWGIVVPPMVMVASWILASVAIVDLPTGEEEELGELLFAICLLLLVVGEGLAARAVNGEEES